MRSTSAQSEAGMGEEPRFASHYDGQTALRHRVSVSIEQGALRFAESGEVIPVADLRPIGDRRSAAFAHRAREGWRLTFDDPLPAGWIAALPRQEHHGGILDRIGIVPALIGGAALTVAILYGLVQSTNLVAQVIPERWEMAFGESLTGDLGGEICKGGGGGTGQEALDSFAHRLTSDGRPVTIRVVDMNMVNAAALPGRQIIIFKGLIDRARTPDEVAGVVAHEIGHVERRHVMAALLRDFGLSLILGGADGGTIAQGLITSRYSRGAERDADDFAIEALRRAAISPLATAGLFERMAAAEKRHPRAARVFSYLSSHPLSAERRRRFAASARKDAGYRPALDAAQWKALRTICKE